MPVRSLKWMGDRSPAMQVRLEWKGEVISRHNQAERSPERADCNGFPAETLTRAQVGQSIKYLGLNLARIWEPVCISMEGSHWYQFLHRKLKSCI